MPATKIATDAKLSFRARGERHGNARLTAEQVRAIRRDRDAHDTAFRVLAERFGVSVSTVGRILRRETWAAPEYEPVPVRDGGRASSDPGVGVPGNVRPGRPASASKQSGRSPGRRASKQLHCEPESKTEPLSGFLD